MKPDLPATRFRRRHELANRIEYNTELAIVLLLQLLKLPGKICVGGQQDP